MIIEQAVTVQAPCAVVWDFLMDLSAVARCMPGVESVEEVDADRYTGTLRTSVGPVSIRFEGQVSVVERNREGWRAQIEMQGADRRSGSVSATTTMTLIPLDGASTEMRVYTDAAVFGKIGEFGQPVFRKKADQILRQFGANLVNQLESA